MTVRVKVCGITRLEDAMMAIDLGATALGFNFVPGSPRRIPPERAREIGAAVPPFVTLVGVFADARPPSMEAAAGIAGVHWIQLHGDEPPEVCAALSRPWYKALRVTPEFRPEDVARYRSGTVLLDGYHPGLKGGTGRTFDWGLARRVSTYARVIVAGGLNEKNVGGAIVEARPYGVDVCSGVEMGPGRKDRKLLTDFMRCVREAAVPEEVG